MKFRKILIGTSWVPPFLLWGVFGYLDQFDGWGAWGAGPLFLPVIGLSWLMLLLGIFILVRNFKIRGFDIALIFSTIISGSVAIFYMYRGFR